MKKIPAKVMALVCAVLMLLPMTSCTGTNPTGHGGRSNGGSGSKPRYGDETDPSYIVSTDPTADPTTDPTSSGSGNYIPTSEQLTYPDHVATVDEIHPYHAPGTVGGSEAVSKLNEVENNLLHHSITSYADIEILFENPEKFGYEYTDVTWGDFITIDQYDEEKAYYQSQLNELLTINYETLQGDDRLCFDRIVYDCEEEIYALSYTAFEYYSMTFNYLVGPQSDILFMMELFSFETVQDAENYILLIKDTDRYFDLMCDFEEERVQYGFASSDNSYEEAAKSFDNLVAQKDDCFLYASFEERLDNIKGLSSADKSRLISEHDKAMKEIVFPEFQECADRMRALKGSGGIDAGLCAYRGGDAYYTWLTRSQTNSNATTQQSIDILDKVINDTNTELLGITQNGFTWYDEYMNHQYTKGSLEDNLDFLRGKIQSDFPGIPAHSYFTMEVPAVFEENFSPAAYCGYHLDNYNSNMIIVNNAAVDKDFGVTVAHEAYPGHMFQSIYTRDHTSHPYLYLSVSIGYKEGWATYVENYSMRYFTDSGKVTDGMTLVKDEALLSMLLSTRADYGIHCENWSLQDCLDYFNSFGFQVTEDSFKEYYTLIVTEPSYYAKYGMGYVWTQKTMDDMHAKYPNKSDLEIHTAYLDSLTGTFEQINEVMIKKLG